MHEENLLRDFVTFIIQCLLLLPPPDPQVHSCKTPSPHLVDTVAHSLHKLDIHSLEGVIMLLILLRTVFLC